MKDWKRWYHWIKVDILDTQNKEDAYILTRYIFICRFMRVRSFFLFTSVSPMAKTGTQKVINEYVLADGITISTNFSKLETATFMTKRQHQLISEYLKISTFHLGKITKMLWNTTWAIPLLLWAAFAFTQIICFS